MKKTSAIIGALVMAACTSAPDGYVIKGTITGIDSGKVILTNNTELYAVSDTAILKGGKFTFTGTVTTPEEYSIYVEGVESGSVVFFLVNGKITITADIAALHEAAVTGPQITVDAQNLIRKRDSLLLASSTPLPEELFDALEDPATPAAQRAEMQAQYDQVMEQLRGATDEASKLYKAYAQENPYSPLTVWFIAASITNYPPAELAAIADSMKKQPSLQNNRLLAQIAEYAANAQGIDPGQIAPDFTQATPNGAPLTFSSIYKKNKLTMIDFWASWCGPCRRFNPALVKIYNKYHAQGFEIVAVSCDKEKDEWLKAIAGDKLTWHHVSDLNFWNNAVAKQYNILSIPQNVFVNADGVIVGKKVTEEALEDFIKDQLK
ncbi:MAG: AhpC/TSA family protein [Prevotellaceae bacterium]|jgi:thiol-disulfide isomerase/thioredoxin|nr:AhpC/TSA family protein [Prevotellaceae bacterium]